MKSILILHDIRSAQNAGSLLRTADAAGIERVYFSGITPTPVDKFNRPNTRLTKASLGAEASVPWEKAVLEDLLVMLRKQGYRVIAIEQSPRASDYKAVDVGEKAAFILGNEVDGLPEHVLSFADVIAEIPMRGKKESLNVAVAGGIALYRMLDR